MSYLVRRSKWRELQRNIRNGGLVLVVDEEAPRCKWCLGRVTAPIASAVDSSGLQKLLPRRGQEGG